MVNFGEMFTVYKTNSTCYKFRRELVVLLLAGVVFQHFVICNAAVDLTGQADENDPNACQWFQLHNGGWVYKCCEGYHKAGNTNVTSLCQECPDGYYGDNCQHMCECNNGGTCDKIDGSCRCLHGYYGRTCVYPCNCKNGASCNAVDGSCICQEGFYGPQCEGGCSCPENSHCDGIDGSCVCRDGFYGSICDQVCECSVNSVCDPGDGTCSCKPGYYGNQCSQRCECYNGAWCGDDDPDSCVCSFGWVNTACTRCDFNLHLENRDLFCKDKCLHCSNGHVCTPAQRNCLCTRGWQGNRCDEKCDEGYYGNGCSERCRCDNGGSCDHVTGTCSCLPGWRGESCDEPCPSNCIDCQSEDDLCTSCYPGWLGTMCDEPCVPGFYGDGCRHSCDDCPFGVICYHVDGSCQCPGGCDDICGCHNNGTCNVTTGECICDDGWDGITCNMTISLLSSEGYNDEFQHSSLDNQPIAWIIIAAFVVANISIVICLLIFVRIYTYKKGQAKSKHTNETNREPIGTFSTCVKSRQPGVCTVDENDVHSSEHSKIQRTLWNSATLLKKPPQFHKTHLYASIYDDNEDEIYCDVDRLRRDERTDFHFRGNNEIVHSMCNGTGYHKRNTLPVVPYAISPIQGYETNLDDDTTGDESLYNTIDRTGRLYTQREASVYDDCKLSMAGTGEDRCFRLQFGCVLASEYESHGTPIMNDRVYAVLEAEC
ncbi:uncharacterized protein LOC144450062 [Glandiceps talaboti]